MFLDIIQRIFFGILLANAIFVILVILGTTVFAASGGPWV